MAIPPIPYSPAFAAYFPEAVETQPGASRDGHFTAAELKKLSPAQVAYLIADGANAKSAKKILKASGKDPFRVCSTLRFVAIRVAKAVCHTTRSASINVAFDAGAVPPNARSHYMSMMDVALQLVYQYPVADHDVFAQGSWQMLPQDSTVTVVLDSRSHFGRVKGIGPSPMQGYITGYTLALADAVQDPAIFVIVPPEAFKCGVVCLATILAHEFYGHVHQELTAQTFGPPAANLEAGAFIAGLRFVLGLAEGLAALPPPGAPEKMWAELGDAIAMEARGIAEQVASSGFSWDPHVVPTEPVQKTSTTGSRGNIMKR